MPHLNHASPLIGETDLRLSDFDRSFEDHGETTPPRTPPFTPPTTPPATCNTSYLSEEMREFDRVFDSLLLTSPAYRLRRRQQRQHRLSSTTTPSTTPSSTPRTTPFTPTSTTPRTTPSTTSATLRTDAPAISRTDRTATTSTHATRRSDTLRTDAPAISRTDRTATTSTHATRRSDTLHDALHEFENTARGMSLLDDLLDDVDDLNATSRPKRRRASAIFQQWLFREPTPATTPATTPAKTPATVSFTTSTAASRLVPPNSAPATPSRPALSRHVVATARPRITTPTRPPPDCGYAAHDSCVRVVVESRDNIITCSPRATSVTCSPRDSSEAFVARGKHMDDAGYHTLYTDSQARASKHAPRPRPSSPEVRESLRFRIQEFNNNSHGLIMCLKDHSLFEGFIRVLLNLIRPINMSTTTERVTSFFLPKNTTKVVHIQCNTTSHDVIRMLLEKYQITDDPAKFALYERIETDGEFVMKKLDKENHPLKTCLSWTSADLDQKMFILQENDHCEINWEIFSIPELENFQRILDREESVYINQLKERFQLIRAQMLLRERVLLTERVQDKKRNPVFV